ncbi:uncharacterized protein JCM15063_000250 [Sporobolomyces koalae]|uniref:uncharacterized protein n=1 Tax=Sporobolomyces koalae TaxID=500713 RepID=UPI0031739823
MVDAPALPVLYGSSTVPYSPLSASPTALVHSHDGQYALVTRDELHLLTARLAPALERSLEPPETSSAFQPKSTASKANSKGKGKQTRHISPSATESAPPKWSFVQTLLKVDKKNTIKWGDWVDDSEVTTMGQIDTHWRSAAFSPTGISKLGGCVLATLTTNAQVLLFEPVKDTIRGEWQESFDLTSAMIEQIVNPQVSEARSQTSRIRRQVAHLVTRAQTSSIAWSGPLPSRATRGLDGSILAVGHRSGEISLWRYEEKQTQCLMRFRPGDGTANVNWISSLQWSSKWSQSTHNDREYAMDLAIGDSDGRVWVATITQQVPMSKPRHEQEPSLQDVEPIRVEASPCLEVVVDGDRRSVSQFLWRDNGKNRQIVYTKLGTVNVVTFEQSEQGALSIMENRELELAPPSEGFVGGWAGSTNWSDCCGLTFDPESTSLQVQLACGLIYDLELDSTLPTYIPPSSRLTATMRQVYDTILNGTNQKSKSEEPSANPRRKWGKHDGCNMSGVIQLDRHNGHEVAFIFQSARPDFFTWLAPSTVKTHFAVVNLRGQSLQASLLSRIEQALNRTDPTELGLPPSQSLLPILNSLSIHADSEDFVSQLIDLLGRLPVAAHDSAQGEDGEDVPIEARVAGALFGPSLIEGLRLRHCIIERLAILPNLSSRCKHRVEQTRRAIERELLRSVIGTLASVLSKTRNLSEQEKPILSTILLASSALPSISLDPVESTSEEQSGGETQGRKRDTVNDDAGQLSTAFESVLDCPACRQLIPLAHVRQGVCLNGHTWERCSITLAVISRTDVRTCVDCHRKALVKVGTGSGGAGAQHDRINRMLEGIKSCAYCAGRWMRIR